MIEQGQAEAFAAEWIEAWNGHDLDAILSHYAEDIEFQSPVVVRLLNEKSGTIRGKQALRAYFERGLAAYPDLRFQLRQVLPGVESVTLYYDSINELTAAEVMELTATGQVRRVLAHYAAKA